MNIQSLAPAASLISPADAAICCGTGPGAGEAFGALVRLSMQQPAGGGSQAGGGAPPGTGEPIVPLQPGTDATAAGETALTTPPAGVPVVTGPVHLPVVNLDATACAVPAGSAAATDQAGSQPGGGQEPPAASAPASSGASTGSTAALSGTPAVTARTGSAEAATEIVGTAKPAAPPVAGGTPENGTDMSRATDVAEGTSTRQHPEPAVGGLRRGTSEQSVASQSPGGGGGGTAGADAAAIVPTGAGQEQAPAPATGSASTQQGASSPGATSPALATTVLSTGAPAATATPAAEAMPGQPAGAPGGSQVTDQVFSSVARLVTREDGTQRLTIRLRPEELGEVRVVLTVRDGAVSVSLAADAVAQEALRHGMPELRRLLELTGAGSSQVVVRDLPSTAAAQSGSTSGGPGSGDLLGGGNGHDSASSGSSQSHHRGAAGASASPQQHDVPVSVPSARRPSSTPVSGVDLRM